MIFGGIIISALKPLNEISRLEALKRFEILDTEPEEAFDDFTKLASFICRMPISMISLVDDQRQWFKSISGWNKKETPRDEAFCAHAILKEDLFIVPDATQDDRFHDNPLVIENPKVKFYAGAPLIDSYGNAIGTLCVMDSEKRELSAEQKETMKVLSRQVMAQLELRLRNIELKKLMIELENTQHQLLIKEKMASLGQLTTGIAHEIKNPLNFINNFASLSIDLTKELSDVIKSWDSKLSKTEFENAQELFSDLEANINKIEGHGKRANNIVNSMLILSPRSKVEFVKTDLNKLIKESAELVLSEYFITSNECSIEIQYHFDDKLKNIDMIPEDFSRVVINLLNNSCYALKKKYLSDQYGKPSIKIITSENDEYVKIVIHDNGTGIGKDNISNIYTPFFTTKSPGEGTGLGLSISYDIVVKYHGGKIEVNSVEGEYTEFTILIPTTQPSN